MLEVQGVDYIRVPVTDIEEAKRNPIALHHRYAPHR